MEDVRARFQPASGSLVYWDPSCRSCYACRRGIPENCTNPHRPVQRGSKVERPTPTSHLEVPLDSLIAAVIAYELLRSARHYAPTVLLSGRSDKDVEDVVMNALRGSARAVLSQDLVGENSREAWSALGSPGRPDIALALDGDLATSASEVRRGGSIGSIVPVTSSPPVTTVVQRELEMLTLRDLRAAMEQFDLEAASASSPPQGPVPDASGND